MISFTNTQIAFAHLSSKELLRAKKLFTIISMPLIMSVWHFLLKIASKLGIDVRPSIYKHFIGGESLEECKPIVEKLWNYRIYSIPYHSVESVESGSSILENYREIYNNIQFSIGNPKIAFTVFRPTCIISARILCLVSENAMLNSKDEQEYSEFKGRVDALCELSYNGNKPILIDAKESWYQKAIDGLVDGMMAKYNKSRAIVYRSFQMYQTGALERIFRSHRNSLEENYILGAVIVRGAYMGKERNRAAKMNYKLPIYDTKAETDRAFNEAVKFALSNIDSISVFCGTHNEDSIIYLISLMESLSIAKNDDRVFFAQLYGMSNNISLNLADAGFNVAKYVPYGSLSDVLPYLMRRSQDNISIHGQTSRELNYIKKEVRRRRYHRDE